MKDNKRRLLKDLPFENLKAGVVIWKGSRGGNFKYSVTRPTTFYKEGGESSGGVVSFDAPNAEVILDTIWDNEEWFEDADITHIDIKIISNHEISLQFGSMDYEDVEYLAKGIQHQLQINMPKDKYVWNKFEVTTRILS